MTERNDHEEVEVPRSDQSESVMVWIDLEMTGLDPDSCAIIEMAIVLTDYQLKEVAPPLELAIWQPDAVLDRMSPFVRQMHEKNGLLAKVRASDVSLEDAQRAAMALVSRHCAYRTGVLCGNSVWQDRRFLERGMPALVDYLHYRQIDVSTVKQLATWWYNKPYPKAEDAAAAHTALFDIRQSIEELRFYRQHLFRQ